MNNLSLTSRMVYLMQYTTEVNGTAISLKNIKMIGKVEKTKKDKFAFSVFYNELSINEFGGTDEKEYILPFVCDDETIAQKERGKLIDNWNSFLKNTK
jgi:hypothetical protein